MDAEVGGGCEGNEGPEDMGEIIRRGVERGKDNAEAQCASSFAEVEEKRKEKQIKDGKQEVRSNPIISLELGGIRQRMLLYHPRVLLRIFLSSSVVAVTTKSVGVSTCERLNLLS